MKIVEGHNAIDILQMDERATLVPAQYPACAAATGWDEGFDAMMMVGKHAMAGTADGILAHTGNRGVEFVEINGTRVGESGNEAAEAGDYGFPTVMISGDVAACREMEELLGDIETAPVKVGYDCHHADCMHPMAARRLVREKARKALERLGEFTPYRIPGPVRLVQRHYEPYSSVALKNAETSLWVDVVDDRTLAYKGQNVVEAFARRCGLDYTWAGE